MVSVIIPTYKRHEKLNRALSSVVNQTYENLEIIVVNDCPEEDIDDFIKIDDPRIKTINVEENRGGAGARNLGIEESKGGYVTFLDDDDEYLPEKVEKQVEKMESLPEDYGLVAVGANIVKDEKIKGQILSKGNGWIYEDQLRENRIISVTPLVKKECFSEVGMFDEGLEARQDYEIWLRMTKKYKVSSIDEHLINHYKGSSDRISMDHKARYKACLKVLEKHKEDIKKDKVALKTHYSMIALELAYLNTMKSFKYAIKSVLSKRSFPILISLLFPKKIRRAILEGQRKIKKGLGL